MLTSVTAHRCEDQGILPDDTTLQTRGRSVNTQDWVFFRVLMIVFMPQYSGHFLDLRELRLHSVVDSLLSLVPRMHFTSFLVAWR